MTKYGYCHVATDASKLEEQKQLLQNEMCDEVWVEEITGRKERPVRDELLDKLEEGDVLVLTGMERLSRNTLEGFKMVNELLNKGVKVQTLNKGFLEQSNSALISYIFEYLATTEANVISERIKEGKRAAKERRLREQS